MNEILRNTGTLTLIILLSAVTLSFTYEITSPTIEANSKQQFYNHLHIIFPDSVRTDLQPAYVDGEHVGEYYTVYDKFGVIAGYAVIKEVKGYQSDIRVLIGFDTGKVLKSIVIIDQKETPGLGSKIGDESFRKQFEGKGLDEIKLANQGGTIDGVTGATVSSSAAVEAVRKSFEVMG